MVVSKPVAAWVVIDTTAHGQLYIAPIALAVTPIGEIDMSTASDLDVALRRVTSENGVRRVVVDLMGVTFIDSSGIHALCRAANGARRDGFDFGVTRLPDHIRRLFVLAGIDQVVEIVEL